MAMNNQRGKNTRRRAKPVSAPKRRLRQLDGVDNIDTNDYEFLRLFITEHGKILPSRMTGASSKQQRQIRSGIRKLRVMGLVQ
ncbi:MAG: 30S ribosomal protein S18 [Verrucomicrobia bacterium]|nr:30S ribosomal protein S18 [Verrucomicrobiota bacterium]